MNQEPVGDGRQEPGSSSTGLDPKLGGLLCYVLGVVTGVIFLIIEKENADIRFHALQSTVVFGGLFVVSIVMNFVPMLGTLVQMLLAPIGFILWVVLMVKAYQGGRWKLPMVGDWVEQQLAGMDAKSGGA